MVPSRRAFVMSLVAIGVLAVSGCGSVTGVGPGTGKSITVGSQSGMSNQVVAHLYGQALEAEGYQVDYNLGLGSRKSFLGSIEDGVIDLVPEFAGSLLDAVDSEARAASIEDVMNRLPEALRPLGLTVLNSSPAEKSREFVTTRKFAAAHSLVSIGDLAAIGSAITIGSSEETDAESTARRALQFSYGVNGWLYRAAADDEEVVEDLRDGNIQVADISSLQAQGTGDEFVVLTDPRHIVVAQNVVPLVRTPVADATVRDTINEVSATLTTGDLAAFARLKERLPATVAQSWLEKHQLVVAAG